MATLVERATVYDTVQLRGDALYDSNGNQILGAQGSAVAYAGTAVTGALPTGGTGATSGAFSTAANRNTFITTVTEMKADFNTLRTSFDALLTALRTTGIIDT